MQKIEAVVKVTRDGFIEVPCEEAVAGDEIRVSLAVEEWVVDAEMEGLARLYDKAKAEMAQDGDSEMVPLRQIVAEREEAEREAQAQARAAQDHRAEDAAMSRAA